MSFIKVSHPLMRRSTPKFYKTVADDKRHELLRLIHNDGMSIRQAGIRLDITYATAKAINRIFLAEGRIEKKKSKGKPPMNVR